MSEKLAQLKQKGGGGCELSIPDISVSGTIAQSGTTVSCEKGDYFYITSTSASGTFDITFTNANIIGTMIYQNQKFFETAIIKTTSTSFTALTSSGAVWCYKKIEKD